MRARTKLGAGRIAAAISIGSALALPACFGTETGNPPFAPEVGGGGFEPMGISPDPALDAATITIERGTLLGCMDESGLLFRSGVLDAVGDALTIDEPGAASAGTYCALELRVVEVSIQGTRRDGATVEIRALEPFVARLEGTFDVTPDAGGLLLAVDRTLLTSGLSLTTLPAVDGVVRIDESTNAELLPAVAAATRSAITLRRDLDDDGVLDREELEGPPLAELGSD